MAIRQSHGHAILVLAALALSATAAAQTTSEPPAATQAAAPQPTAGERFKSVRVLTDMPASLIIPTMAFISNALGVT